MRYMSTAGRIGAVLKWYLFIDLQGFASYRPGDFIAKAVAGFRRRYPTNL